jgi:hypothetical protein
MRKIRILALRLFMNSIRRRLFGVAMIITGIFVLINRDLFITYFSNRTMIYWLPVLIGSAKIVGGTCIIFEPDSILFPIFVAPFLASIVIGIADEFIANTFYGLTDIVFRIFILLVIVLEYFPYRKVWVKKEDTK